MLHNRVANDDTSAAEVLTPDLIAEIKKEDMKQAIVERFSHHVKAVTPEITPADEKR